MSSTHSQPAATSYQGKEPDNVPHPHHRRPAPAAGLPAVGGRGLAKKIGTKNLENTTSAATMAVETHKRFFGFNCQPAPPTVETQTLAVECITSAVE